MPDDRLEIFRLRPTGVSKVDLVMKTDGRDGSATVEHAEDLLRARPAHAPDIEAESLGPDEVRELRDRGGLVVVGSFVHDLGARPFREADKAQVASLDGRREFGFLADDERTGVFEYFGGHEIRLANEGYPRQRTLVGHARSIESV